MLMSGIVLIYSTYRLSMIRLGMKMCSQWEYNYYLATYNQVLATYLYYHSETHLYTLSILPLHVGTCKIMAPYIKKKHATSCKTIKIADHTFFWKCRWYTKFGPLFSDLNARCPVRKVCYQWGIWMYPALWVFKIHFALIIFNNSIIFLLK